jgi:hypothetical protein
MTGFGIAIYSIASCSIDPAFTQAAAPARAIAGDFDENGVGLILLRHDRGTIDSYTYRSSQMDN